MRGVLPVNGIRLVYREAGVGPAVLLIHGHPFDHTMWRPQVDALREGYRVITPDLRGYGRSALPDGVRETPLETLAADHLALLDALGIRSFILGGVSLGGQVALEVWRQAPARVTALVLADTFAGVDSAVVQQQRRDAADRIEAEGMAAYARELLPKMIAPQSAYESPAVVAHVMAMMTTTPPRGAAAALRGRARRRDYLPLLKRVRVPTLVLVGSEDAYTPVAQAEALHAAIAGSQLAVIGGVGHLPNLERPDAFNQVLRSFLDAAQRRLPAAARGGPTLGAAE